MLQTLNPSTPMHLNHNRLASVPTITMGKKKGAAEKPAAEPAPAAAAPAPAKKDDEKKGKGGKKK